MRATPKKLKPLPLDVALSAIGPYKRANSYLSNGPNSLDPVLMSPMNNTTDRFNINHTPTASKVFRDYVKGLDERLSIPKFNRSFSKIE